MEKKETEKKEEAKAAPPESWKAPAEKKWEEIFSGWLDKVDQEGLMTNLFELKLWFEGLEEYHASTYMENLLFRLQPPHERSYSTYLNTFQLITNRMIMLLKDLDFKKDKLFLNFEEFIVDRLLEDYSGHPFSDLLQVYSPESWFYNFRIFLQNFRMLVFELLKNESVSQKVFSMVRKLYHRELVSNPILVSLLKNKFLPKLDRITQVDISRIIAATKDRKVKKEVGIFFVLSYRIMKTIQLVETHVNKSRSLDMAVPLLLMLKKYMENLELFTVDTLFSSLQDIYAGSEEMAQVAEMFANLKYEMRKMFEDELPEFFDTESGKGSKRRTLKNITLIAQMTMQELVGMVSGLLNKDLELTKVFPEFTWRKDRQETAIGKLQVLYAKINRYFIHRGDAQPSEITLDIQLFMERDLHALDYAKWSEFRRHYQLLAQANTPGEFDPLLRNFLTFLADSGIMGKKPS